MKILHRVFSVTLVTLCVLGVIFMVSYTFNTHSFLTKIDYELNASETAYTVKGVDFQGSKHVVIPEEHNGKPVTAIADAAFAGCYGLKSVTIPATVTKIGETPFDSTIVENVYFQGTLADWCKISFKGVSVNKYYLYIDGQKLVNAEIPTGVKKISDYAFASLKGLKTVTIADSVTQIGKSAFDSCSALETVVIGNGVTQIGKNAFYKGYNIKSITFGNSIQKIDDYAFDYCESVETVTLPASLTEIGKGAFNRCDALVNLTIGENVTSIGDFAFDNCISLPQVEIPAGVTKLNKGVFSHCKSLESVTFHENLTEIGESAFSNCESLTEVVIPSTVAKVGKGSFQFCKALTSVTIAADSDVATTFIDEYAFQEAVSLKTVIIGNGVNKVRNQAFSAVAGIETLVIGKNVTEVEKNAFYRVSKANTKVYYLGTAEEWDTLKVVLNKSNMGNGALASVQNLYFYSETQTENGWRYVEGVPTAW